MDIYTVNGNIIRQFPKEDGTTEIELEFLFDDLFWTRLYSIAIYYIVFCRELKIDYVQSSHTYTKAVIRQDDFNDAAKQMLIDVTLDVKEHSTMLRAYADRFLFNQKNIENIETSSDEYLSSFKVVDVVGKKFLEEFAEKLGR